MPTPPITTAFEHIAWSYAHLARAHAAVTAGRTRYARIDHIIRTRLFNGLKTGRMSIRSLYEDERAKNLSDRACVYCGAAARLTMDHVVPRLAGGRDSGTNLVVACRRCNGSKGSLDLLC